MQVEYNGEEITLKKDGYNTAVLPKSYLMRGRSGGVADGLDGMTSESVNMSGAIAAAAVTVETTAGVAGYIVGGVAGLVIGLAVPPAVMELYADNHHFVTLFPENATIQETMFAMKQTEVRHLVLTGFDRQFQSEYITALSIQARLPENTVKRLLRENPTPDAAASAIAAAMK